MRPVWYSAAGIFLSVPILLAAAYESVTARIEAGLPVFLQACAEQGWRVESDTPQRAGWPWTPTIRLPHLVVTRPFEGGSLRWTADRVDLTVPFHDLTTLAITPAGDQTMQLSPYAAIHLRAGLARLRVPLKDPAPISLELRALAVEGWGPSVQLQRASAEITGSTMTLAADSVQLSPSLPAPFNGPATWSMRLLTNNGLWSTVLATSAANWAAAGGRIDIRAFDLNWGPMLLTGNAVGQLDGQLQPAGQATLQLQGSLELIDAVARAGLIAPSQASAARAVTTLLVFAAHGGPITVPIAIDDRTLTVARFPLMRLPSASWTKPSP